MSIEGLKGRGLKYQSPILALRQHFGLDVCMRPCRSFPGNPANFVKRGDRGAIEEPALDIVVFRQNTEGLYAGVEWTDPPAEVRRALAIHPRFAPFTAVPGPDLAITVRIVTRAACERILDAAFRYADSRGIDNVTLAEKPNVLRETSGLFEEAARETARSWPQVRLSVVNIDALLMDLARRPEGHGVIVASNLFGDIVSDAVAGLTGGPGFSSSANLGAEVAIFEPTRSLRSSRALCWPSTPERKPSPPGYEPRSPRSSPPDGCARTTCSACAPGPVFSPWARPERAP